jgi:hypothetical protein
MEHHLKVMAQYYDAVSEGTKTFEVRKDDRGFQKGDVLVLHRFTLEELNQLEAGELWPLRPVPKMRVEVTYILTGGQFGIEPGYVVLGIRKV